MRSPVLEKLNPVTSLAIGLVLLLPLVVTIDWLSATVVLAALVVTVVAARVPIVPLLRRSVPLLVVAPIGATSMALYGQVGGHVWWRLGPAVVSDQSLVLAAAVVLRVFALGWSAIVLGSAMDATRLADALSQVLRLPPRFVLGTVAGARMVGLFTEDWQALAHARRARGLGDAGRLRRWFTMSFALLVFAVRRGSVLATAMEARGFGGAPRTWARPSRLGRIDAIAFGLALLVAILAVVAAVGFGTAWVY
ncbi:energy-coupling factor transporter transmembrane component T family protein [Aestuariimicrobium sp. T2.26MG-19.2B]|uniref:energy-coupling factor transporter transmembrane component T family protein n=1 Tax=Aestuariimicrobium sp. T2.26MG-19.2B TaxID=3040679 RepID=UPI002477864E|nr:energy-coupling factor transporter transmembrane component T [Aestuariimicrobium sp. T2.26MG-19.2B]CAI9405150.1 Putative HMP/thiamine permease protein YkoC [Aestuariimicrobium sp. T2.26MG-19.2B]